MKHLDLLSIYVKYILSLFAAYLKNKIALKSPNNIS